MDDRGILQVAAEGERRRRHSLSFLQGARKSGRVLQDDAQREAGHRCDPGHRRRMGPQGNHETPVYADGNGSLDAALRVA
jgi:hypothetical protein